MRDSALLLEGLPVPMPLALFAVSLTVYVGTLTIVQRLEAAQRAGAEAPAYTIQQPDSRLQPDQSPAARASSVALSMPARRMRTVSSICSRLIVRGGERMHMLIIGRRISPMSWQCRSMRLPIS
jgi:hypothetical protein